MRSTLAATSASVMPFTPRRFMIPAAAAMMASFLRAYRPVETGAAPSMSMGPIYRKKRRVLSLGIADFGQRHGLVGLHERAGEAPEVLVVGVAGDGKIAED